MGRSRPLHSLANGCSFPERMSVFLAEDVALYLAQHLALSGDNTSLFMGSANRCVLVLCIALYGDGIWLLIG